jgi:hypothetical protein
VMTVGFWLVLVLLSEDHFSMCYMLAAMLQHGILTFPRLPSGLFGAALV